MSSFHRIGILIALAGCIDPAVDPEPTAPAARIAIPEVTTYVPGRIPLGTLFPAGLAHLHVAFTPGQVGTSYVWGIADDRILWIYRVADDDGDQLDAEVHDAWRDAEQQNAFVSFGSAGTVKGDTPKPPTPPGQPEFSAAYAERVVTTAQAHARETELMLADLEALQ